MAAKNTLQQLRRYAKSAGSAATQIERAIKRAYEGPVGTLIREGQTLREQAYPAFFGAFERLGTGAGDLSPAAALAAAMSEGERAMTPYRVNLGLRDYYDTLINDLVAKGLQGFQMGYGALKDLYYAEFSREQFEWQKAEAARRRAAAAAAAAATRRRTNLIGDLLKKLRRLRSTKTIQRYPVNYGRTLGQIRTSVPSNVRLYSAPVTSRYGVGIGWRYK